MKWNTYVLHTFVPNERKAFDLQVTPVVVETPLCNYTAAAYANTSTAGPRGYEPNCTTRVNNVAVINRFVRHWVAMYVCCLVQGVPRTKNPYRRYCRSSSVPFHDRRTDRKRSEPDFEYDIHRCRKFCPSATVACIEIVIGSS
jgi:hypothetical protein